MARKGCSCLLPYEVNERFLLCLVSFFFSFLNHVLSLAVSKQKSSPSCLHSVTDLMLAKRVELISSDSHQKIVLLVLRLPLRTERKRLQRPVHPIHNRCLKFHLKICPLTVLPCEHWL